MAGLGEIVIRDYYNFVRLWKACRHMGMAPFEQSLEEEQREI